MTSILWRAMGLQPVVILMGAKKEWIEQVWMGQQLVDLLHSTDQLAIFVAASVAPPGIDPPAFATMAPLFSPVLRFLKPDDTLLLTYNGLLPLKAAYVTQLRANALTTPSTILMEAVPPAAEGAAATAATPLPFLHSQAIASVDTWRRFLDVSSDVTFGDCAGRILDASLMAELRRSVVSDGGKPADAAADAAQVRLTALPTDMLAQLIRYKVRHPSATSGDVTVSQFARDMRGAELRGPPGPWRAVLAEAHKSGQTSFFGGLVDAWAGPGPTVLAPTDAATARITWAILHPLLRTVLPADHPDLDRLVHFHEAYTAMLKP